MTYVAAGIGMLGGVSERLPLGPTVQAQLASSFVNRVTPANVGGMALNVRYLQKAGVPPAEAVTGIGLNVLAGGVVHIVLLIVFFAWAGQDGAGFALPSSSKLLVVIAVVLALIGIVAATRRGRHLLRVHVLGGREAVARQHRLARPLAAPVVRPVRRLDSVSRSPTSLRLTCAVNAFDGGLSFAQVGAVYLGASMIAAAAPTPGGLGAMEAALVAGFTAHRHGRGDRRGDRAQLPPGDVLAADPARLDQLPACSNAATTSERPGESDRT